MDHVAGYSQVTATQKLLTFCYNSDFCWQFSNQAGSLDANQQLQMALEEKASLETQVAQVKGCMKYNPDLDVCKEMCGSRMQPELCINTRFLKLYPLSSDCQIYLANMIFSVFYFALNSSQSHFSSSRQKEISM